MEWFHVHPRNSNETIQYQSSYVLNMGILFLEHIYCSKYLNCSQPGMWINPALFDFTKSNDVLSTVHDPGNWYMGAESTCKSYHLDVLAAPAAACVEWGLIHYMVLITTSLH